MASTANAKAPREVVPPWVPQVTGDQLSLELEAGNKEQIAQAVARPRMQRQVEVRKVRPELVSRYSFVCVGVGGYLP